MKNEYYADGCRVYRKLFDGPTRNEDCAVVFYAPSAAEAQSFANKMNEQKKIKFKIVEFDKDYRVVVNTEIMEFTSLEEANTFCKSQSLSGYSYSAHTLESVVEPELDGYPAWLSR